MVKHTLAVAAMLLALIQIADARPRHYKRTGYGSIVSHPAGCPTRLFCGCGVSVRVFGRPVRSLFLAANWGRFPSAAPGSGMVAYRSGHVMYIEQYLGNGSAIVYDPNSGGGATRVHNRSLRGYRVVNPRAGRHLAGIREAVYM